MICAQLIVVHHFLGYGIISTKITEYFPNNTPLIFEYSRMVVQIFLVIAGYFAMKTLSDANINGLHNFTKIVIGRYLRLVTPFVFAILIAIFSAYVSNEIYRQDFVPELAGFNQLLAHIFLLHGVLNFDSLSSGVWYVAIDFQLFIVLTILCLFKNKYIPFLISIMAILSLFIFNLNSDLDNYAIYFFGSYSIGALTYLYNTKRLNKYKYITYMFIFSLALIIDFRERILIAVLCGLMLTFNNNKSNIISTIGNSTIVKKMSNASYSLFLSHFSILMISNALIERLNPSNTILPLYLFIIWFICVAFSFIFEQYTNYLYGYIKLKI